MCKITLIATVHKERGSCNSKELYKLIAQITPDVIFEELSHHDFTSIYRGLSSDTLETNTIKLYLKKNPISHFPVDLDGNELPDKFHKKEIVEMFDILGHSHEYNELLSQQYILSKRIGFQYLNSDQYRELSERRITLEKIILKNINHEKWIQTYKIWLDVIEMRENEMIKNIYNYCDKNRYSNAIFLIGAEHRKSIMDKTQKLETKNKLELNWDFNYFI